MKKTLEATIEKEKAVGESINNYVKYGEVAK